MTGNGSDEIHGRAALNGWITGIHSLLRDLELTIELGPITTDDFLVVRWRANGVYAGGLPGSSPDAVGKPVTFTGTLRVVDSMLAEYWANADSLLFCQQLGLLEHLSAN